MFNRRSTLVQPVFNHIWFNHARFNGKFNQHYHYHYHYQPVETALVRSAHGAGGANAFSLKSAGRKASAGISQRPPTWVQPGILPA